MRLCRALIALALLAACDPAQAGFTAPVGTFGGPQEVAATYNLTVSTLPSGISCARTGTAPAYPARSASTFVEVDDTDCIYEDRGDITPGGWWAFEGFENLVPDPFTPTGTGWTSINTTVSAAGSVTCPDGNAGAAYKIATTTPVSGSHTVQLYGGSASGTEGIACGWLRDDGTDTPTFPLTGVGPASNNYVTFEMTSGGSGTTWRRKCTRNQGQTYSDVAYLYYTPSTVAGNEQISDDGAINVCGSSLIAAETFPTNNRIYALSDLPLIDGTTGDQDLEVTTPSGVVQSGDFDVEMSFVPAPWSASAWDGDDDAYFFGGSSTDGELSLRWNNTGAGRFIFAVRGTDVITANENTAFALPNGINTRTPVSTPHVYNATGNLPQEMAVRAWYKVSTGDAGLRICINGACNEDSAAATTGSALAALTSFHFLSQDGSTGYLPGRVTKFTVYKDTASNDPITPYGVAMGDSLTRSNTRYVSVPSFFYNANEARVRNKKIAILALGGDTCEGQLTALQASTYHDNTAVRWFTDQCGINNIGAGDSAATLIGKIQDNVDYIKLHNPGAKIVRGCITPAYAYWVATYGGAAADARETIRQTVNTAIQGGGGTPITDIDAYVCGYNATLEAVDGKTLKTQYDINTLAGLGGGDGLHYSDEARGTVVAPAYRTALDGLGL